MDHIEILGNDAIWMGMVSFSQITRLLDCPHTLVATTQYQAAGMDYEELADQCIAMVCYRI